MFLFKKKYFLNLLYSFLIVFSCLYKESIASPTLKKNDIILDAEVSWIMQQFLKPIYKAANISTEKINVYIIVDSTLNAFAVPTPAIFINTGLLFEAERPEELLGVLAHETGHIARHHFSRRYEVYKSSQEKGIILGGLGLLLGILAGSSESAVAGLAGGMDLAQKSAMHFTRGQEASADQAALNFLDRLQWSASGLYSFFKKLEKQDSLPISKQSQFLRSHPLSQDRMNYIAHHLSTSPYKNKLLPADFNKYFDRLKAKVYAYIAPYSLINKLYPKGDSSLPSRYAQAILAYRQGNLDNSLKRIRDLIHKYPDDPFFYEFQGILFCEQKKFNKAIASYEKALKLLPNHPFYYLSLAHLYMDKKEGSAYEKKAQEYLRKSIKSDPSPMAWYLLAVLEGRQGKVGVAALALSERNLLLHNIEEAEKQAKRALFYFQQKKMHKKEIQRAKDIISTVQIQKSELSK